MIGAPDRNSSEKTIAILADSWGPHGATHIHLMYVINVVRAQRLKVSLLGVGTLLHVQRDAWSLVK